MKPIDGVLRRRRSPRTARPAPPAARNAYILLRNSIYFDGDGITQALIVLLLYLLIPLLALAVLDYREWFRTPDLPVAPEAEDETAAVSIPVGALP